MDVPGKEAVENEEMVHCFSFLPPRSNKQDLKVHKRLFLKNVVECLKVMSWGSHEAHSRSWFHHLLDN